MEEMKETIHMKMEVKNQLNVIASCFSDCVDNFDDDTLGKKEKQCLTSCIFRMQKSEADMNKIIEDSMPDRPIDMPEGVGGGLAKSHRE